jgi:benzodiazapine receptor
MTQRSALRDGVALIAAVALCLAIGFLGGRATAANIPTWYAGLVKPSFNPPNWLFGPVWTLLYAMMAFALWRVLGSPVATPGRRMAVLAFVAQMVLNALWSVVFFGLHAPGIALFVIVALEALILTTIALFRPLDRLAALLLVPYAAWVAFATILNAAIWMLNR